MNRFALLVLLLVVPMYAVAATSPEPLRVAVLDLKANDAASADVPAVNALLASRLAQSPELKVVTQSDITQAVTLERQKQILGQACDNNCVAELSGAVGARYLVTGRLDRLGNRYLLTATLFDAQKSVALAKPTAEALTPEELPSAVNQVAKELLAPLGVTPKLPPSRRDVSFGIKVGNTFFGLAALNPAGDIEIGYRFVPATVAFLQVGFSLLRADGSSGVSILPSVLGLRQQFRLEHDFQPYAGGGLGVQLAFGRFGIFRETGVLPMVLGIVGFDYLLWDAFSVGLEGSTNLAQLILGLEDSGQSRINADLNATFVYRF